MRYVVLGCGAIGGTVAAGLARDGHDVLVSDADPAVVSAVMFMTARSTSSEGTCVLQTAGFPFAAPAAFVGATFFLPSLR